MHAPVLVTAPVDTPVSLVEAKAHLRVDHSHEDGLITALIRSATGHLDGWTGILGCCLMQQDWRQDFDGFDRTMRLLLWPVSDIVSITSRNTAGQIATVDSDDYILLSDSLGAYVRFKEQYSYPSDLYQVGAVSVTFRAGYADAASVPADIKAAILLLVGHWYRFRSAVVEGSVQELPMAVNALLAKHRRVGL